MRLLVACSNCKWQFDASALQAHDHFRCRCGLSFEVPEPKAHDAAVVRCSACGAPRQGGHSNWVFCDSDFTLHEQDLHTICSGCMARISDRAKQVIEPLEVPYEAHQLQPIPILELLDYVVDLFRK